MLSRDEGLETFGLLEVDEQGANLRIVGVEKFKELVAIPRQIKRNLEDFWKLSNLKRNDRANMILLKTPGILHNRYKEYNKT